MKSLFLAGILGLATVAGSAQCGIKPIKPIPPVGCKDLRAECVCDVNGQNCKWEWVCVPE
jgi:hypothetical protein